MSNRRSRDEAARGRFAPGRRVPCPPQVALAFAAISLASVAGGARAASPAGRAEGAIIDEHAPPEGAQAWVHACSLRHPLCVHAAPPAGPGVVLPALGAAERAWETLTGALGTPAPDPSDDGAWHVYLVAPGSDPDSPAPAGVATALLQSRDAVSRFDRGASYALVDRGTRAGCALDLAMARAVARGSIWRTAPATDPGSARAESEALARLATPCAPRSADATTFQGHPERTPVDPFDAGFDRGAALLFEWLDARFGASPGLLVTGMAALSPTRSTERWRWPRRPSGFDVLRVSLGGRLFPGSTLEDAVVRFAVDRATMVPPARVGWRVGWPARPRRLLAPEPVAPLGAGYVVVDTRGRPDAPGLHLETDWEDYGRMRWVVVKVDAAGRTQAELAMGSLDRGTHASLTVEKLAGTDHLLVVGVNVGDTEAPFDPAAGEWEPHGWTLTLAEP